MEKIMRSIASRAIYPLGLMMLLLLLGTATAFGQASASLSGVVHDPQGNAVSGAKVVLTDPTKNFQLETTTSGEGTFTFTPIAASTYEVSVEAQGFKKALRTGIVVNVSDKQSTGVIQLEVGQIGDVVEVTAAAAQLQIRTESGEQGNVITNTQVQNLAINGRNYLDLLKLTPGV